MDKHLSVRQCFSALFELLAPQKKKFFAGIAFILITCTIFVFLPYVEGSILSQLQIDLSEIARGIPGAHIHFDIITRTAALLLAIYALKISSQFAYTLLLTDAIQDSMEVLRARVQAKINHLPVSYFDRHPVGDLLSRITNDAETLSTALQQTLPRIIMGSFTMVSMSVMVAMLSMKIFLILICGLPLIAAISLGMMKKSQPLFDAQQQSAADLNSTINELYGGLDQILIYNRQEYAIEEFRKANESMRKNSRRAMTLSGMISPLCGSVTYTIIAFSTFTGCLQVMEGALLLGSLQACIRYIWNIVDPISQLAQLSGAVQSALSGMNRLFSFLQLEEEAEGESKASIEQVESIDFENVAFSYTDQPLLKDVSFHAGRNQTIAIVGHTGAGKTTITNLLLGYYPIQSGAIKINGTELRDLSRTDLHDLIGLVLQDPWTFEGTIRENLLYAKDGLTEQDLQRAITAAGLQPTLDHLDEGLDTMLHDNAKNLSQGEKQLLTIARAMLKDPKILILDEATSSVDTRMEKRVQKAMDAIMKERTCLVIAHRLSTIVNADCILVMENGDVVESGTHEQLLAHNGKYAALYTSQFQNGSLTEASSE